ncbi:hypothetical protein [Bacillus badius]|uniref:Phage protein n=1 Tax=Bacillus badius TaxID=1455 RepID=A0ABR5APY3_BACBA|nr:hypothetical protein [Bacillus badius]KIL72133.1 hypothetical protein SD77_3536 [Bacillus badius]MED4718616.1 hypothetical protein [Bacillus badius]
MKVNVTSYHEHELHTAIADLERRGFTLSSDIKRITTDGKMFTHDWKVPEFAGNSMNVKYMCQMTKEENVS